MNRFVKSLQTCVNDGQVVKGLWIIRLKMQSLMVRSDSLVELALAFLDIGEVEPVIVVTWPDADGMLVGGNRSIKLTSPFQDSTQIVCSLGIIRRKPQCFLEAELSLLEVAGSEKGTTEVVLRRGGVGVKLDCAAMAGGGFAVESDGAQDVAEVGMVGGVARLDLDGLPKKCRRVRGPALHGQDDAPGCWPRQPVRITWPWT